MPKFSIITPIRLGNGSSDRPDRIDRFIACIKSVAEQTFKDFEWIIIDDGTPIEFNWKQIIFNPDISQVNLVHKEHGERVIAYNRAFEIARGDWWCFLDSDDELKPNALERMDFRIEENLHYKMFNFGTIYAQEDGTFTFREPFTPKRLKVGHKIFGGGNIVNGSFVFHRSIYEDLGGYPGDENGLVHNADCTEINYPLFKEQPKPYIRDLYMGTPYDFSAAMQLKFPEIRRYFMVDHESEPSGKIIKELGNPWGQDFALWYQYTRKYHSKPIKEYLYIVHPK